MRALIRALADERHHGAALEPPDERGRGALQPRRDHPRGAHRLRGPARRAARIGGRQLHAAHVRRRRAPRRSARRIAGIRDVRRRPRRSAHARGDEAAIEALSLELAQPASRLRALVPDAASLEERFFALTEDAATRPPAAAAVPSSSGWRDAAHRSPSTAGSCASSSRRSAPTSASPPRCIAPTIFVVALAVQSGAPNDVPFGRYVRDTGLAAPLVLLTFGSIWLFPLIASLVAGRHRRRRGRQRHAQDHPHAQRHARADVRGQGRRGASPTRCSRWSRWPSSRSRRRPSPGASTRITSLSGTTVSAWRGLALVLASLGVYALAAARDHGDRRAALDRHAQLRRRGGRRAHDRAADAADRHPARVGAIKPYLLTTQFDAWHGFLRTRSTGRRSRAAAGSRRSTPPSALAAPTSCSCAATSPAAKRPRRRPQQSGSARRRAITIGSSRHRQREGARRGRTAPSTCRRGPARRTSPRRSSSSTASS